MIYGVWKHHLLGGGNVIQNWEQLRSTHVTLVRALQGTLHNYDLYPHLLNCLLCISIWWNLLTQTLVNNTFIIHGPIKLPGKFRQFDDTDKWSHGINNTQVFMCTVHLLQNIQEIVKLFFTAASQLWIVTRSSNYPLISLLILLYNISYQELLLLYTINSPLFTM